MTAQRKILYVAEASSGGIGEYSLYLVAALAQAGWEVEVLCRPDFPMQRLTGASARPVLPARHKGGNPLRRLMRFIADSCAIAAAVAEAVEQEAAQQRPCYVLLDCFREYLAPFWVGPFRRLHRKGTPVGVVAHDPVRDFVVGPQAWHQFSIRQAYCFVDDVFVHDARRIDFGGPQPERIAIRTIPHGPYTHGSARAGRTAIRAKFGFADGDFVLLAFGQIRNGKNLDVVMDALPQLAPDVKLLVAGSGGSASQRPPQAYQEQARVLGVADRCAWDIRYIGDDDIADLFAASDAVLLTYSKDFVSASGVLNTAVVYERPVLASGGMGPLETAVKEYPIGVWLEEVTPEAIADGVRILMSPAAAFSFAAFQAAHTWEQSAATIGATIARHG